MGWKDVRVHLLAPGARVAKEPIPGTRTLEGDPVQRVGFEVLREMDLPSYERAKACMEGHQFCFAERSSRIAEFTCSAIKASLTLANENSDNVVEIRLEFECSPNSEDDLGRWSGLADSIADELNLSVMDYGSLVPFDSARQAITSSRTWQEFADQYGWMSR